MSKQTAVLMALLLVVGVSCTKSHTGYPSCTTSANIITITDAGTTYCAGGAGIPSFNLQTAFIIGENVGVSYGRVDTNTVLYLVAAGASFELIFYDWAGPLSGIGSYTIPASDTVSNIYTELFTGGQSYKVSGGTFDVTQLDSANVSATFTLNIFNTSGSKVITGMVNANHPKVLY